MTQVTLKTIYDAIQDLREEVKQTYVTKDEFNPVRAIVFGMVGLALTCIFTAVLAGIIKAR